MCAGAGACEVPVAGAVSRISCVLLGRCGASEACGELSAIVLLGAARFLRFMRTDCEEGWIWDSTEREAYQLSCYRGCVKDCASLT